MTPSTTHSTSNGQELQEHLRTLENCLETPVVPGELEDWAQSVHKAWQEVSQRLPAHIEKQHAEQIKEIAEQDDEMLPQVEELRDEDVRILDCFHELAEQLQRLIERARKIEPNEQRADHAVSQLVEQGLNLIIRIRKQEAALTTWFGEAFNRDRGTGD